MIKKITVDRLIDQYYKNLILPYDIHVGLLFEGNNKTEILFSEYLIQNNLIGGAFMDTVYHFINEYKDHKNRYGAFWVTSPQGKFILIKDNQKPL